MILRRVAILSLVLFGFAGVLVASLVLNVGGVSQAVMALYLSEITGKKVSINGTLSFSWSSDPVMRLTEIEVEETLNRRRILGLESIETSLSLTDLVSGDLVIPDIRASGLEFFVYQNDRRAIEGNRFAGELGEACTENQPCGFLFPILETVSLQKARFQIQQEGADEDLTIDISNLSIIDQTDDHILKIEAEGLIAGVNFVVSGTTLSPREALSRRDRIPLNVTLTSPVVDAEVRGEASPFSPKPKINLAFDVSSYAFQLFTDVLLPDLDLSGLASARGRMSGPIDNPMLTEVDVQAVFDQGGGLQITGKIDDLVNRSGIDLAVRADVEPPERWLEALPETRARLTYLSGQTRIIGDATLLSLTDASLFIETAASGVLEIRGDSRLRLPDFVPSETEFKVDGQELVLSHFAEIDQHLQQMLGPLSVASSLDVGLDGEVRINSASVGFAALPDLKLSARGGLGRLNGLEHYFTPKLDLTINGDTTRPDRLAALVGVEAPYLNKVSMRANLSGELNAFDISDIKLRLNGAQSGDARISGHISDIRLSRGTEGIGNVDLEVNSVVTGTKWVSDALDIDLPELGAMGASFSVRGALSNLAVEQISVSSTERGPSFFEAGGNIGRINTLADVVHAGQLDLTIKVTIENSDEFVRLLGRDLPMLRAGDIDVRLAGSSEAPTIPSIELSMRGDGDLKLQAHGAVLDPLSRKGVDLKVEASLDPALLGQLAPADTLGRLTATARLVDSDGSLGLENILIENRLSPDWSLIAEAEIDDVLEINEIEFQTSLTVPEPNRLISKLGWEEANVGAIAFNGLVKGSDEAIGVDAKLDVGTTRLTLALSGDFKNLRPNLRGKVFSEHLDLSDFGVAFEEMHNQSVQNERAGVAHGSQQRNFFSAEPLPLELLPGANLDIELHIDEFGGAGLSLDRIRSSIRLNDGVLALDPINFELVGGRLQSRLRVDAREIPARLQLSLAASALDLETAFKKVGSTAPVDGFLTVSAVVKANGASLNTFAASLSGEADIAVTEGYIRSHFFDLLGYDLLSWMLTPGAIKGKTEIRCFVGRLDSVEGKAKLTHFVLDTPGTRVGGVGEIDLSSELLDLTFAPRPKLRLVTRFSSPVTVEGPFEDPRVDFDVVGMSADTLGKMILSPVTALSGFMSMLLPSGKPKSSACS